MSPRGTNPHRTNPQRTTPQRWDGGGTHRGTLEAAMEIMWKTVVLRSSEFHRSLVVAFHQQRRHCGAKSMYWSSHHVMITSTRRIAIGGWLFMAPTGFGGANAFCSWDSACSLVFLADGSLARSSSRTRTHLPWQAGSTSRPATPL